MTLEVLQACTGIVAAWAARELYMLRAAVVALSERVAKLEGKTERKP